VKIYIVFCYSYPHISSNFSLLISICNKWNTFCNIKPWISTVFKFAPIFTNVFRNKRITLHEIIYCKVFVSNCYITDQILCSKCPPLADTQASSRLQKSFALLVRHPERRPACKNWVIGYLHGICLGWGGDLNMAQLIPLPLNVSCSNKSR